MVKIRWEQPGNFRFCSIHTCQWQFSSIHYNSPLISALPLLRTFYLPGILNHSGRLLPFGLPHLFRLFRGFVSYDILRTSSSFNSFYHLSAEHHNLKPKLVIYDSRSREIKSH